MIYLLFASAFSLSSIAAYYAIMGLIAIFSGAAVPIMVMGAALELSKIVLTSWLYRNWKDTSVLLKSYFIAAIIVLMTLTSMGIFGFLSKAHSEQGNIVGDALAKVQLIDEQINIQKEIINDSRKTLSQLDSQVNETINRTSNQVNSSGVDRSVSIRKAQARERESLAISISKAQEQIQRLNTEKAPLSQEARKIEAEVGPIKYIAALIYGDDTSTEAIERAVRIVIIMIVAVFDPLAVLMFIAVNQTLSKPRSASVEKQTAEVHEPIQEVEVKEEKKEPEPSRHIRIADGLDMSDTIEIEKR